MVMPPRKQSAIAGAVVVVALLSSSPQAAAPKPYLLLWNSPWPSTCATPPSQTVDWQSLHISGNANFSDNGVAVSTFQPENTGLLPYYVSGPGCAPHKPCIAVNGGLPQRANVTAHLEVWRKAIKRYLPNINSTGAAALDWENWKLSFEANLGGTYKEYEVYVNESVALVRLRHPRWPADKIYSAAKAEFEAAARTLFTRTIDLARQMRPAMHWGFCEWPLQVLHQKYNLDAARAWNTALIFGCCRRLSSTVWLWQDR